MEGPVFQGFVGLRERLNNSGKSRNKKIFTGKVRLTRHIDPESFQTGFITGRWDMSDVHISVVEFAELFHGKCGGRVHCGAHTEGDQCFS